MEVLNGPWRSTLGNGGDVSLFFLKLPSFRPQAVPGSRRLRVSSRLGRHPRRRNHLREKLLAGQDEVRRVLEVSTPQLRPEDSQLGLDWQAERDACQNGMGDTVTSPIHGGFSLTLDRDVEKDAQVEKDSLGKRDHGSASVLWDKLEDWVEQHKRDTELWGIGDAPVFTVYKDSYGSVIRVSLNEDEIVRRSRVGTWSLSSKEFEHDDSVDVNAKISHAKLIAKKIESGEYKLPKNSTVARIVIEGSKSLLSIDRFPSLNSVGKTLVKLSPQIVFGILFGSFVFWSLRKLLSTNDRTEPTSEEKKMLRRKFKSRMERGTAEKGGIEVLGNIPELPVGSDQRPPLDKNELMMNIKAKASTVGSVLSNSSGCCDLNDANFRDRVREIREMVKQVCELEGEDQPHADKMDTEDDVYLVPITENKLPRSNSNADIEIPSMVNGSDFSKVPDDSVLGEYTEVMDSSCVMDDSTVQSPSNIEDSEKTISVNEFMEADTIDNPAIGTLGSVNEMPVEVSAEHTNPEDSSRGLEMNVSRKEEMEQGLSKEKEIDLSTSQDGEGIQFDQTCQDNSPSVGKNSVRMKPKVIVSVREAREYLSHRYASTTDKLQSNPKTPDKGKLVSSLAESPNSINDGIKVVKSPELNVTECAKDNANANESCSHMVHDHVAETTNQRNISDPSCTAAETGPSSVDIEAGETGCQNGPSPDFVEDKIPKMEAIVSIKQHSRKEERTVSKGTDNIRNLDKPDSSELRDEEHHYQESLVKTPEVCNYANDKTIRELKGKDICTATGRNETFAVSSTELTSAPSSIMKLSVDVRLEADNDNAGSEIFHKANECADLRPSATCNETAGHGDSLHTKRGIGHGDSLQIKHNIHGSSDPCTGFSLESNNNDQHAELKQAQDEKCWVDKNFQQFDPIIKKIGVGFKENYMAAREKVQEQKMLSADIGEMALEDEELEWMNDDNLRDIVLKVRDNELAGREPFHLMGADEQSAFFKGLERKAEKENTKLLALHELIHSKIENIDYGMDGISLDDPLGKIVPRWKGPPISEDPEFLNNFAKHQQGVSERKVDTSLAATLDTQDNLQKSDQSSHSDALSPSAPIHNLRKLSQDAASINPRTVIECSDGSSRAGKKLGKEHWEHTKKWSREFLELYNAETDPEIKSIMRDMGKDLDKWITEKEIQDVADLMTRIPKRKRKYIDKKLDKLKREIEMFGHEAVVSKYKEYSEEKDEDYLWWLDLSFILCIELYRTEDNAPKVGFYSLEMAADLELTPKQYHVVAFEDPSDSKNFCYIIQAHMEMLGNGSAFVVARPPKDAFREAKANGFNVTVIKKGQLKLNIDQTLEEVEEEIIEIGSKMYHDKIMRERSIDVGALTKGVFNADKPGKRKSKRVLKKPAVH